ncbi:hypothetical protein Poly30_47510 [Planctomycetes bacterium Poly30]|uniref:Uncharacterized protein n=1 Tax=Saltatorellus ferox TaxID=2528018 RepID=A0A518EYR6_9BACT|nr:hypothetical protein Poly30_47510 [Planctomycetes bacterium Poly30]
MKIVFASLGALFVAGVIVLAFWLDAKDSSSMARNAQASGATPNSEETSLTDISAPLGAERTPSVSARTTWSVKAIDGEGKPLHDARIQASRGGAVLEATGRAEWSDVAPGNWTLVATADERPVWRREIEIEFGQNHTTIIQLTMGVQIDGRVRDTAGRDQAGRIVGFVPRGERAPELPIRWLELPHARTTADGRFSLLLPDEGNWRLFVGWGGQIAFEEAAPQTLTVGGKSYVEVTVAAPTRLIVEVEDEPGVDVAIAHGVTVYRDAERLATERASARLSPPQPPPVAPLTSVEDEESKLERETVERHEEEVRLRESDPEAERLRALRMGVVPSGWAKAKSGFCGLNGRIEFERLPVDEELRFAVSRSPEAFAVDGSAYITAGAEVIVKIELPPPLPSDAPPLTAPRRVSALVMPSTPGSSETPGAVWR